LPWPTDYILTESDRRYHGTVAPDEPKNLAEYVPEQWDCKVDWHAARSSVAHSLNRRSIPEINAMIGQGPLAHYTGGPEPLPW
jgi:hypothetical protein